LTLAEAVAKHFDLTFFNGGPVPQGFELPANIRFEHLPPLRLQEDGTILGDGDTASLLARRRDRMLEVAGAVQPALLIVELYPFGRKKFAVEIDPLIDLVRAHSGKIACSVRDVLVNARVDQGRHDDRAATTLNAKFDCVLVHTDPSLFALTESFRPSVALTTKVVHTGYITRNKRQDSRVNMGGPTLVAAGGGAVGHALYRAAIKAQPRLWDERGWAMTLVAGPLFPEEDWHDLCDLAEGKEGLTLVRSVPSMAPLLTRAGRFVGQCGYNSALEVCQAGLPALFVPFSRGQESEQRMRAEKLKTLGLADTLPESGISGEGLAEHVLALTPPRQTAQLDLSGAQTSAQLLKEMVTCRV
jgi:predicted glycosyltransferase